MLFRRNKVIIIFVIELMGFIQKCDIVVFVNFKIKNNLALDVTTRNFSIITILSWNEILINLNSATL